MKLTLRWSLSSRRPFLVGVAGLSVAACGGHDAPAPDTNDSAAIAQVAPDRKEILYNAAASSNPVNSAASAPVTDATHFDLHCSVVFRIISRGSEGMGNALALFTGDRAVATPRYVVDLGSMRSCVAGSCEQYGTRKIVRADAGTITFEDERGEDWHRFDRYDRRTGRYIRRIITDGGWNLLHTGTCRRRPFSGLPDRISEDDRPPSV